MSREVRLTPPVTEDQARSLACGDVVYIDGVALTWRDRAIERMFDLSDRGEKFPFHLEGCVHWHCGPIVRETGSGWTIVSAGPTGSIRFSAVEARAVEEFGVRVIVGKGGMLKEAREALKRKGAVFLASVGGVGSLYAKQIHRVKEVHWLDLGIPEAVWVLEMKNFGPLLVAMDSHGKSLYADLGTEKNLEALCGEIDRDLREGMQR
jgi:fumarate hydratase subunit beta